MTSPDDELNRFKEKTKDSVIQNGQQLDSEKQDIIHALEETCRILREKEESYQSILESVPYSIVISRLSDAHYMYVNKAFCKRTGYTPEEVIDHPPHELELFVDINDQKRIREIFYKNNRVDNMEVQFKAKDGRILENLLSTTPITYNGEACLLTVTVFIGELKAAQRSLKESEERYRNILKNMEEGYWEMDLKGYFTFVNEAECRIHQRTEEEILTRHSRLNTDPETSARMLNLFKNVYKTGMPVPIYDIELQRPDNTTATIESSVSLLRDAEGTPVGFFGISRDISEKRRTEKELEKYREHLEHMVQERTVALEEAQEELVKREKLSVLGQLTATVSHELRNPLGVIRSSNFYLQRRIEKPDDKIIKHLKRIEDQIALCDGIVADLLEYTRGRNVSVSLTPLLPWLKALLREIEETQDIQIKHNLPDDLPDIPHDQEKMRRVFINLIENAIHATRDRAESKKEARQPYQPEISLTLNCDTKQLIIAISDNGTGMDKKTLAKAFEPLFTTRARGTGIGLANVQRIINDHGGTITLESTSGHGTTATISLLI
ncbi:MAG: PAS domain S-box protein [Proteobacteria bacterium]|nr:PAS domain S-box protein [Pseudomonadota bacterium]MBU1387401.1 PAS domain S-box protein [Pseudomonadota bacterium]MBU1541686.1 PAS domain S-box protein [Pseudomonadota bacterium]MBU2482010.1 PAS domain S-box protein [Pseudomonadota bacterium]